MMLIDRLRVPAASLAAAAMFMAGATPAHAQTLHTNDRWDDCSFVFAPGLTQDAFRQFVDELGEVMYFRPLASARPLGRGGFDVSVLQWNTRIERADAAWNDTFSHPDSAHHLFEGNALPLPGALVRIGVTDRVDAGAYFTTNPNANYSVAGAQLQYDLKSRLPGNVAAATRLSAVRLFGPEDVSATVYGLDLVASMRVSVFEPYAVLSGSVTHGDERGTTVELKDETVFGGQVTAGVAVNVWKLRIGAELHSGPVGGSAVRIGFGV